MESVRNKTKNLLVAPLLGLSLASAACGRSDPELADQGASDSSWDAGGDAEIDPDCIRQEEYASPGEKIWLKTVPSSYSFKEAAVATARNQIVLLHTKEDVEENQQEGVWPFKPHLELWDGCGELLDNIDLESGVQNIQATVIRSLQTNKDDQIAGVVHESPWEEYSYNTVYTVNIEDRQLQQASVILQSQHPHYVSDAAPLEEGHIATAEKVSSLAYPNRDDFLNLYQPNGEIEWSQQIAKNEYAIRIATSEFGEIAVLGKAGHPNNSPDLSWVSVFDDQGEMKWKYSCSPAEDSCIFSSVRFTGDQLVLSGYLAEEIGKDENLIPLVRVHDAEQGDILMNYRRENPPHTLNGNFVAQDAFGVSDGVIALFGTDMNLHPPHRQIRPVRVIKINPQGQEVWEREIGFPQFYTVPLSISPTESGAAVVAGLRWRGGGDGQKELWIRKTAL